MADRTTLDTLGSLTLLENLKIIDGRAWRFQGWLLDQAHPAQQPGDRDSLNPLRRAAGWLGCRIQDRLIAGCRSRAAATLAGSSPSAAGWNGEPDRRPAAVVNQGTVATVERGTGCYDCGLPYGDPGWCDVVLTDADWLTISPTGHEGGLLCFTCIARRLTIEGRTRNVPMTITSGPFAFAPTRQRETRVAQAIATADLDPEWDHRWDQLSAFDREHYRRLARAAEEALQPTTPTDPNPGWTIQR